MSLADIRRPRLFLLLAALDTLLFWCLKWLHPVEEAKQ